jgi:hypothetical protein
MKTKMFLSLSLPALALAASLPPSALAQVPSLLSYQGRVQVQGSNYTGTGRFKLALVNEGVNLNDTATARASVVLGQVSSITVSRGGSGYTSAPRVRITDTLGGGRGATAVAVVSHGSVASIDVTDGGSGYRTSPLPTVLIDPPPVNMDYTTYWSHDGTSAGGSEPTSYLNLSVDAGLFMVRLGDTSLANMDALPAQVFTNANAHLRIWFSDVTSNFVRLIPDQPLTTAPYAFLAQQAVSLPGGASQTFSGAVTFDPPSGAPFIVGTTNRVASLNADLLDGLHADAFWWVKGNPELGNSAGGEGSFAAGRNATAGFDGSFVWGDGSASTTSGGANRFVARAIGGVRFYTDSTIYSDTPKGISLNAQDRPMITREFDKFATNAPADKAGLGRWGLFMEPMHLIAGIPDADAGDRAFAVWAYRTNGTHAPLFWIRNIDGQAWFSNNVSVATLTIRGGADLAEPFAMSSTDVPAGALVVIDPAQPGRLKLSTRAYDRTVAGIVSGAHGIQPGISMVQEAALEAGRNVALSGRVYALVDATTAPVEAGDLLTTSDTPGHAMKVTDHARGQGAIVGKAMSSLKEGKGLVLVLVSLQ